jgi:HlyD family secretion protein
MKTETGIDTELKRLRIDRSEKNTRRGESKWTARWIIAGILLFVLLGAARLVWQWMNAATPVETARVRAIGGAGAVQGEVILNATGYIIAAHKIELASKVVGKVSWIGVEKGDRVKQGQVLVRLEDDEYRAQVLQARGNLAALEARLAELQAGSRPEEIARAKSDVETSRADLENARVNLERVRKLVAEGVMAKQSLDDAQARYDSQAARTASLQRTADLAVLGPRKEQIDAVRGQIDQARGQLAYVETLLSNTVIKAPVSGTILERNVEKGEFVTTGFVGDRGAKGYVVSIADLNDLQVELDINQNDFAKLDAKQKGTVTTDAYPDRKYEGVIYEISPEANRQKATVQVKVKVLNPDDYLRPEMNASVAFLAKEQGKTVAATAPLIVAPAAAVKEGAVFVVVNGKVVRRPVKAGGATAEGLRIEAGLMGGEDVVVNPPAELKDGSRVKAKAK